LPKVAKRPRLEVVVVVGRKGGDKRRQKRTRGGTNTSPYGTKHIAGAVVEVY